MKEKKRTRGIHTAVVLPPDVLDQLRRSELGVSEEIRRRVALTLEDDAYDAPTRELVRGIMRLAAEVERETGCAWHDHSGAHLAFRQAILSRLARLKPKQGPITFGERPHQTGPGDDPQIIGQWVEYSAWETRDWTPEALEQLRIGKEESWREIVRLQQQREHKGDKS
jgi:hypothetical protein